MEKPDIPDHKGEQDSASGETEGNGTGVAGGEHSHAISEEGVAIHGTECEALSRGEEASEECGEITPHGAGKPPLE